VHIVQRPAGFASVGSRLLLSCSYTVDSAGPVKVSWVRGRQRVEGDCFIIESVRRQDEGSYTCVVDTAGHVFTADTLVRVQCTYRLVYYNNLFDFITARSYA